MSSMDVTNQTKETLRLMFLENKRFDGRKVFDIRDFEISYNVSDKAEGSARIKMGKTEVIVGVKLSPGEPYPDSLEKGNLIVSADLLPLASPRFEFGPPGFEGIELPRLVDRIIRDSDIIEFSKLVINPKKKVWNLYIDIYPINDDGSLIDVATIAAVAALHKTFVPELDSEGRVDYDKKSKVKLPINDKVVPISFSFYKLGEALILNPTREEEEACDTRITLGLSKWNGQYMMNSCQKAGETVFSNEDVLKISEVLPKKYDEVSEKLKKFF